MKLKTFFLILVLVFSFSSVYAEQVCDFDGNQTINDKDLIVMLAYLQTKGLADSGILTLDIATVQSAARNALNDQTLTVTRLPDKDKDDLESDAISALSDNDLILFLVYIQKKGLADAGIGTLDFAGVEAAGGALLNKTLSVGKFPGTEIGNSTVPVTITGISTD
jgi:hypothetical protein